jgi:uncharacterized DUF497 family protein
VPATSKTKGLTSLTRRASSKVGPSRTKTIASGLLAGVPVSVVHTESEDEIRIISFRKATKHEAEIYFREVEN